MDTRTAAALCILDLAPLIEGGDFGKLGAAEAILKAGAVSVPPRFQSLMLYRVGIELHRYPRPALPQCDAILRAVRATVRHRLREGFERRLLTAGVVGA